MQITLLGNPSNRRCHYLKAAAKTMKWPPPFVVGYLDWLEGKIDLAKYLAKSNFFRLESPGEDAGLERQLLALGATHPRLGIATQIAPEAALQLTFDRGRIQYLKQQHLGFLQALERLEPLLAQAPAHLHIQNSLDSIRLMFDKTACHQHFTTHKIPVPPALYGITSYDSLRQQLAEKRWLGAFIKPEHGSSASGVIAFRWNAQTGAVQAITSIEYSKKNGQIALYNALKIRTYDDEAIIATIINYLANEGILVERWIPKAALEGGSIDLRMVSIGGQAQHTVVRQSQSPMTNLHLGNQRGSLELLQQQLGAKAWEELRQLVQNAAATLPEAMVIGFDVLISSTWRKFYLAEANAFGDLLPRIYYQGKDTYQAALHYLNILKKGSNRATT